MGRYDETITIASGQTTSGALALGDTTLTGLQLPAAFTGASITFQVSVDGATYTTLYSDDGTAYSITVAASRAYALTPATFYPWPYVKVVSASSEASDRAIVAVTRDL